MSLGGPVVHQHIVEFTTSGVLYDGVLDTTDTSSPFDWTVPDGVTQIQVSMVSGGGGGGGGGGPSTTAASGVGGGGGGTSGGAINLYPCVVVPRSVLTVTIGAKGTGGAVGGEVLTGSNGTAGGVTSILCTTGTMVPPKLSIRAGNPGLGGLASTTTFATGGAGGANYGGGAGVAGGSASAGAGANAGGQGLSSTVANVLPGLLWSVGGAGGGASNSTYTSNGGAGGIHVFLTPFFTTGDGGTTNLGNGNTSGTGTSAVSRGAGGHGGLSPLIQKDVTSRGAGRGGGGGTTAVAGTNADSDAYGAGGGGGSGGAAGGDGADGYLVITYWSAD